MVAQVGSQPVKRSLSERLKVAKKNAFLMPDHVTCTKDLLSTDKWAYVFSHNQLGTLGRLLFIPNNGETQCNFEVYGDQSEALLQKRWDLLEPIAETILNKIKIMCAQ